MRLYICAYGIPSFYEVRQSRLALNIVNGFKVTFTRLDSNYIIRLSVHNIIFEFCYLDEFGVHATQFCLVGRCITDSLPTL